MTSIGGGGVMENEASVVWGATLVEGLLDHPNCDYGFAQRSVLSAILDRMPFSYEESVLIRARDPERAAPVLGSIRVRSEAEQREVHAFLKDQVGRSIASVLEELSALLRSRRN